MRRLLTTALVAGAMTLGGASLALAAPTATTACQLITWAPFNSANYTVSGTVGRSGCSNYATWEGNLSRDISFAPDPDVATGSGNNNSTKTLSASCNVAGSGYYYTGVRSSTGANQESGRFARC